MSVARFEAVAYGVDDLTLGFDMEGSPSVAALNAAPGSQKQSGKMLGEQASWGKWVHLLGRSISFWKSDTKRLYVQAKLADAGELCPPRELAERTRGLIERMAAAGVVSYERPWVTRVDVAVDADCESADGKLLLDALEAVRLPNGWRTTSTGNPRSTVYFRARATEHVHARAYCRNLKTKSGEAYGRIRLEAEQRFDPKQCPLEYAEQPGVCRRDLEGPLCQSRVEGDATSGGGSSDGTRRADAPGRTHLSPGGTVAPVPRPGAPRAGSRAVPEIDLFGEAAEGSEARL
jgi:hypothetical protein